MLSQNSDTSKERIYKKLRSSIILNAIKPGERLQLDELAAQYSTSVTPVREALQMLVQEGLVENKPHAGFYAAQVTLKQLRDMLEMREILEIAAVERAVKRITAEQIEALEKVHVGYAGDDDTERERYLYENKQFHYLIALASGNQMLADTLQHLHDRLAHFLVFVHTGDEIEKRHQRLIDALRTHNTELAKQTILNEVNETCQITLEHITQEDGAVWLVGASSVEGESLP